jgi:hypothetical protein
VVFFFWICFDMGDNHLVHLHLRTDFEARRQGCLQFLATLEAMGQGGEPVVGDYCFGGFEALSEPLRHVDWPQHFRPVTPASFNESSDPVKFLWQYAVAIRAAGGDRRVMANWFPMATKDEPRWWIWGLPLGSISSWRDLCERFLEKYAPLGPEPQGVKALAALGGLLSGVRRGKARGLGALPPHA